MALNQARDSDYISFGPQLDVDTGLKPQLEVDNNGANSLETENGALLLNRISTNDPFEYLPQNQDCKPPVKYARKIHYSYDTIQKALAMFTPIDPETPKNDPRRKNVNSLKKIANDLNIVSRETIRQWLKKDMSAEAVRQRLSNRGRKRKLNDCQIQIFENYIKCLMANEVVFRQKDVIKYMFEKTGVTMTNTDVTRYLKYMGYDMRSVKLVPSDEFALRNFMREYAETYD